jgi:hypothetical protein
MHFTTTLYLRLETNRKISIFYVAKTSYFKKQIFHLSEEPFFQIFDATIDLRKRPLKTLKNGLPKGLRYLFPVQKFVICKLSTLKITVPLCTNCTYVCKYTEHCWEIPGTRIEIFELSRWCCPRQPTISDRICRSLFNCIYMYKHMITVLKNNLEKIRDFLTWWKYDHLEKRI